MSLTDAAKLGFPGAFLGLDLSGNVNVLADDVPGLENHECRLCCPDAEPAFFRLAGVDVALFFGGISISSL